MSERLSACLSPKRAGQGGALAHGHEAPDGRALQVVAAPPPPLRNRDPGRVVPQRLLPTSALPRNCLPGPPILLAAVPDVLVLELAAVLEVVGRFVVVVAKVD